MLCFLVQPGSAMHGERKRVVLYMLCRLLKSENTKELARCSITQSSILLMEKHGVKSLVENDIRKIL